MEKMEELKNLLTANVNKVTELLHKKEKEEIMEEKKKSKAGLIFAIIGIVVVVAAAAYGLYRFFAPDYLEDFEDDFDDDFEDDSLTRMTRKRNNHYHLHNLTGEDVKGCVISCSPFTECAGNAADDMCFWKRIVCVR
nr:hypothetical protein [Roseburia sp. AF25-25LB]